MVLGNSNLIKQCPIDDHINSWKSLTCENCGGDLSLVSPKKKPTEQAKLLNENDWKCPGCGLENSPASNKCFECFHPKDEGDKITLNQEGTTIPPGDEAKPTTTQTNHGVSATLCFKEQEIEICDGLVVGRDPNLSPIAHFVSSLRNISRAHARFHLIDNEIFVEDLDSTNGTRVNMFLLKSRSKQKLEHLDKIAFSSDLVTEIKIR